MAIYLAGSDILIDGGNIATSEDCCCGGECVCDTILPGGVCTCNDFYFGPNKSLRDATITISNSSAMNTGANNGCGSPNNGCPSIDGTYVVSCTSETCWFVSLFECTSGGTTYTHVLRLRILYGSPSPGAFGIEVEIDEGQVATSGVPPTSITQAACNAFLRNPRSNRLLSYVFDSNLRYIYDPSNCDPSCEQQGEVVKTNCQYGSKSWTSDVTNLFVGATCDPSQLSVSLSF